VRFDEVFTAANTGPGMSCCTWMLLSISLVPCHQVTKSFEAEQGWRRKLLFGGENRKPVTIPSPSPYAIDRAGDKNYICITDKKSNRIKQRIEQLSSTSHPTQPSNRLSPLKSDRTNHLARRNARVLAVVANASLDLLGLDVVVVGALELDTKLLDAGCASVGDGRDITVVGVDASEDLAAGSLDVLDGDVALGAVALAVAAGAVELAEVLGAEAVDGDGRGGIVLDDLVVGVARATTLDHDGAGALEGEGVFADVGPPDVWGWMLACVVRMV
jgi:hypothetical protein